MALEQQRPQEAECRVPALEEWQGGWRGQDGHGGVAWACVRHVHARAGAQERLLAQRHAELAEVAVGVLLVACTDMLR